MAITINCALYGSLLCLGTPAFAAELPSEVNLPKGSEVILVDEMSSRESRFLRYDDGILLVEHFASGRFEKETVSLQELSELRVVKRHRSAAYPVAGGLMLGGLGAAVGAGAFSDGSSGTSDSETADMRGLAAMGLGLLGFVVGFVTGAEIAPETRSEEIVWSRN